MTRKIFIPHISVCRGLLIFTVKEMNYFHRIFYGILGNIVMDLPMTRL